MKFSLEAISSFEGFFTEPVAARAGLDQVFMESVISDYELTLVSRDGRQVPVMCNATILEDAHQVITGVLVNARDMRELKRAQEVQEMYARELARANADLEEFATVASHDLQEPLKKVAAYAEDLAQRYKDEIDLQAMKRFLQHR